MRNRGEKSLVRVPIVNDLLKQFFHVPGKHHLSMSLLPGLNFSLRCVFLFRAYTIDYIVHGSPASNSAYLISCHSPTF